MIWPFGLVFEVSDLTPGATDDSASDSRQAASMDILTFSIIIPTYNRPRDLCRCLEALAAQNYPQRGFEVIVVDDGSAVPLSGVVASVAPRLQVRLLTQANAGPAQARNTGAAAARGTYLAFTDDDCVPLPDWLRKLAARFAAAPDQAVGGPTLNLRRDNLFACASQYIADTVTRYYNAAPARARLLPSCNLAAPRRLFLGLGGFAEGFRLSEDREFCDRWLNEGQRLLWAPEVQVYHNHALTFSDFWRRFWGYGRGAFHFHQVRAQRSGGTPKPELQFYLSLLKTWHRIALGEKAFSFFLISLLLLVWQLANVGGFVREALSVNRRALLSPSGKEEP